MGSDRLRRELAPHCRGLPVADCRQHPVADMVPPKPTRNCRSGFNHDSRLQSRDCSLRNLRQMSKFEQTRPETLFTILRGISNPKLLNNSLPAREPKMAHPKPGRISFGMILQVHRGTGPPKGANYGDGYQRSQ